MTIESNTARDNISILKDNGFNFHYIADRIGSRRSIVKDFYECTGKDLDAKQCDCLSELVKELT